MGSRLNGSRVGGSFLRQRIWRGKAASKNGSRTFPRPDRNVWAPLTDCSAKSAIIKIRGLYARIFRRVVPRREKRCRATAVQTGVAPLRTLKGVHQRRHAPIFPMTPILLIPPIVCQPPPGWEIGEAWDNLCQTPATGHNPVPTEMKSGPPAPGNRTRKTKPTVYCRHEQFPLHF